MEFENLQYERRNHIGLLKINRPDRLNALNGQVIDELLSFLDLVKTDVEVRALVITGAGTKAFVAGADIKEMETMSPEEAREMSEKGQRVFQTLESLRVPTVAAINGFALGGGLELALSCDFIVAQKEAKLGLPEVSLGLIPGYGGTQRLPRIVGKATARLMILTGNLFSAQEAHSWGLVALVTEPDELLKRACDLATDMARRSPVALALAKRAINEGHDKSQFEAMRLEADLFSECFKSGDRLEGIRAFIEKRQADFKGFVGS